MSELIEFKNFEEYTIARNNFYEGKKFTKEEIEKLSPDNIDNTAFWKESWEKFGPRIYVPINNPDGFTEGWLTNSNLLASSLNAFHPFEMRRLAYYGVMNVLEIGPGLGNLWSYLRGYPAGIFNYSCYDIFYPDKCVIPQNRRIQLEEVPDKSQHLIYSVNVFQHLTPKQWNIYFNFAYTKLVDHGYFVLSYYSGGKPNGEDGKSYIYTFGQLTECPIQNDVFKLLDEKGFSIIIMLTRYDGHQSLFLQKKSEQN